MTGSEGGGQHTDHPDCFSCGRRHRSINGLHVAQELHSLCSCHAWREKVSFHNHLDIFQQCNHFKLFYQSTLLVLGSMFDYSSETVHAGIYLNGASLRCFLKLPYNCSSNFVFFFFLQRHCSKECLVTSSGIDNTENGLSGSKADSKPTPKKKWESARI